MPTQVGALGALPEDAGKYFNGNGAWSAAWPVGSIFLSAVATNPATLLGFGTWVAIGAGRVLVGIDAGQQEFDVLGETGGAKTVALSVAEMPSHSHTQDPHGHVQNSHSHNLLPTTAATGSQTCTQAVFATDTSATAGTGVASANIAAATATNQNTTAVNQNTGGGGAHSNLQPYLVIAMWQRTA